MLETSKALPRRLTDHRFVSRYFVGNGIDIGSGNDCLGQYIEFFPLCKLILPWDIPQGDAQYLFGVDDETLNFVHSSHCLEHMEDPLLALTNWMRVLRPGGHAIILVPDEDLYEQGVWPSTKNPDHKWSFTLHKPNGESWCKKSWNVFDLIQHCGYKMPLRPIKVELLDGSYRRNVSPHFSIPQDQTLTPIGECAIEFILQKV
jgi:SAM-dependent methyltransferase